MRGIRAACPGLPNTSFSIAAPGKSATIGPLPRYTENCLPKALENPLLQQPPFGFPSKELDHCVGTSDTAPNGRLGEIRAALGAGEGHVEAPELCEEAQAPLHVGPHEGEQHHLRLDHAACGHPTLWLWAPYKNPVSDRCLISDSFFWELSLNSTIVSVLFTTTQGSMTKMDVWTWLPKQQVYYD